MGNTPGASKKPVLQVEAKAARGLLGSRVCGERALRFRLHRVTRIRTTNKTTPQGGGGEEQEEQQEEEEPSVQQPAETDDAAAGF